MKRVRLLAGVVVAGILCGCSGLPQDAVDAIDSADDHYRRQRYDVAARVAGEVIARHPRTAGVESAYYLRGLARVHLSDLAGAEADLVQAVDGRIPDVRARAQAQLGHLAYVRQDFTAATPHYAAAVDGLPDVPPKDEVIFRYADSLMKTGDFAAARQLLPRVWHDYPNSPLAVVARRKFAWPHDHCTVQCGAFRQAETAQQMVSTLRLQQFDARVQVDLRDPERMHRVVVGTFPNFRAAQPTLDRIRTIATDAMIVP